MRLAGLSTGMGFIAGASILLLLPRSLPAQGDTALGALAAHYTNDAIVLDGRLEESAWGQADSTSAFRQQEPAEGEPGTEATVLRVLYDRAALYVGFRCYDREPGRIRATQLRRDTGADDDDFVTFLIDGTEGRRGAYVFGTNPRGTHYDLQLEGLDNENLDWNGIWDVAARRDSLGWSAEFRIPFHTLRFRSGAEVTLGFNARRFIRRKNEIQLWRSWKRNQGLLQLLEEGTLTGIHGVARGRDLELRPYLLARAEAPLRSIGPGGADSVSLAADRTVRTGLDARFAVTPTITGDLTLNTDFAQVEVDRQVINLTRFPVFFPEKREFFLESSGIFDFGRPEFVTPFYSRTIGLKNGAPVTILGGARVTGRAGPWVLGGMGVRTGGTDDANDLVLRAKHDLLARSYVGGITTLRWGPGVMGTEVSGGLDADFPLVVRGRNIEPAFWISGTRVPGRSGTPLAWRASTDFPNDLFDIFASLYHVDRGYTPTLGFVRRDGIQESVGHVDFMPRPHHFLGIRQFDFVLPIPSWDIIADRDASLTRSREWQTAELEWRPLGADFHSGDRIEFNLQRFLDAPSDSFTIFRDLRLPPARYWWSRRELQVVSSPGRPVSFQALFSWGGFYDGSDRELSLAGTWRTGGHLVVGADLTRHSVHLPAGDFTSIDAGGRIELAFSTRTELLVFGQHNNEDERVDFQLRFHWIPRVGDDLYLVWNSGYTTDPAARFRFASSYALRHPLDAAFTVKAIHRIGL